MGDTKEWPNTPEQDEILEAWENTRASLMIDAKAGTGKTHTLSLLGSLMDRLPRKYQTLVLVFNKKNQLEMKNKFPSRFDVLTLNSLGFRAFNKAFGRKTNVDFDKDSGIFRKVLERLAIKKLPDGVWQDVMALVSSAKVNGLAPAELVAAGRMKFLMEDVEENWETLAEAKFIELNPELLDLAKTVLLESCEKALKEGLLDGEDMIYHSVLSLGVYPKYPVVMVDESQDLSPMNHQQLKKALEFMGGRLVVVGDPRQAIYAFRGADTASMSKIRALRNTWVDLDLSVTFRCPKAVVARQQKHVPGYVAFEGNAEGEVVRLVGRDWTLEDIPEGNTAILSRINANLLSCAFRLISAGHGVQMLGRDLGKQLVRLLDTIAGKGQNKPVDQVLVDIREWEDKEVRKWESMNKPTMAAGASDRAGCFYAIMEMHAVQDLNSMRQALVDLFESNRGRFILGTGHRAKGMEWPTVLHLDPWRIPSKYALDAAYRGFPEQLEQERNLQYVLETRAQHTLILADLKEFTP